MAIWAQVLGSSGLMEKKRKLDPQSTESVKYVRVTGTNTYLPLTPAHSPFSDYAASTTAATETAPAVTSSWPLSLPSSWSELVATKPATSSWSQFYGQMSWYELNEAKFMWEVERESKSCQWHEQCRSSSTPRLCGSGAISAY